MRFSTILIALSSTMALTSAQVVTGQMGDAIRNLNDPAGATYQAIIPPGKYGTVKGSVVAVAGGSAGTDFAVNFDGLPTEGGPFSYHIHVMTVGADGNCNDTLAHLDPFIRGEDPACTASRPETCQVGDLGGKYGKANGTSFSATFTDPYVSLVDGVGAFFGNRSFVVHFANKSRIACANFQSIAQVPPTGVQPQNSTASATLVPALNANTSAATVSTSTTLSSTTLSSATMAPSSTSAPAFRPSSTPKQSTTSAAVKDVASKLLLLSSLALALWVL